MARGESSEPVPAELLEFARAALDGRRVGSELAELVSDSVLDGGGDASRRLEFRAPALSIELEVHGLTLLGRLAPAAGVPIEVELAGGEVVSGGEADADGRFRLVLPQGGRVRLLLLPKAPGVPRIESSWITI
jgi:hypothetical protein